MLADLTVSMERFKSSFVEKQYSKSKSAMEVIGNEISDFVSTNQDIERNYKDLKSKLNECCYEVTLLSLLQPQLQNKKMKVAKDVTLDTVLQFLQKHTRKKEVFVVIPLIWQIANHRAKIFQMKSVMLDSELQKCHQRLELHTKFVLEILSGLRKIFDEFEANSLSPLVATPLSNLLAAYQLLQNDQTNENFANFFDKFDSLVPNLETVVKLLKHSMEMEDSSELQKQFKNELVKFTKGCLLERRKNENDMLDQERENKDRKDKLADILASK